MALLFGFFMVHSFNDLLAMGVLLGIAGASFGVALSLGSGSFPPQHKGLAMGLAGAGNVGHRAVGAVRAAAGAMARLAEPSTAWRRCACCCRWR